MSPSKPRKCASERPEAGKLRLPLSRLPPEGCVEKPGRSSMQMEPGHGHLILRHVRFSTYFCREATVAPVLQRAWHAAATDLLSQHVENVIACTCKAREQMHIDL